MIETNPLSFARRQTAALRRATFTSLGFPPGTLRDAARDEVTYEASDFGSGDGPIDEPALASSLIVGRHPDGWTIGVYSATVIPDRWIVAEWDVHAGRPVHARRVVVQCEELDPLLIRLIFDAAVRRGKMIGQADDPDAVA